MLLEWKWPFKKWELLIQYQLTEPQFECLIITFKQVPGATTWQFYCISLIYLIPTLIIDTFSIFVKLLSLSCLSSFSANGPTSYFTEKIQAPRRALPHIPTTKPVKPPCTHIICFILLLLERGYFSSYLQLTLPLGIGSNSHLQLPPPGFGFCSFLSSLLHHRYFLLH